MPPAIQQDYRLPELCADAAWRRPKLWLGAAGTVMPLHFDLSLNLYAMVAGRKRFCLFPPSQSLLLYPCGLFSKAPNFAQVDPEAPDPRRFPRFGRARPVGCVLRTGDLLYIPRGWWHHVRTLDDSIAIGFWYGGRGTAALNRASIAYRRLMGQPSGEWG
jgi:lysine-specific demethylase 8